MHKVIIFLSILLVILLLVKYFYCDNEEEYFADIPESEESTDAQDEDNVPDPTIPQENEIEKNNPNTNNPNTNNLEPEFKSGNSELDKFLGLSKTINLITKFNGKDHILLSVKKDNCTSNAEQSDCLTNILIIMELSDYQKYMTNNKYSFEDKKKLCNLNNILTCQKDKRSKFLSTSPDSEISKEMENKIESECKLIPDTCTVEYQNSGDFNLVPVKNYAKGALSKKLYKLLGKVPLNESYTRQSMSLIPGFLNLNKVCFDGTILPDSNQNSSFELLEVPQKDSNEPHFIIRFVTNVTLKGNHPLNDAKGNPIVKTRYVGICKDDKCKIDGSEKYRLCLYETESNPFVLTFIPKLSDTKLN